MGLRIYTVHDRSAIRLDAGGDADVVLVREGFSWAAFVFSGFWFFAYHHWREGILILMATFVPLGIVTVIGMEEPFPTMILVLSAFSVGLFAQDLRRHALTRTGYAPVGVIAGHGLCEVESRYLKSPAGTAARSAG